MSGGSHNYICYKIEEELVGSMGDAELNDLMKDIAQLAHDLEWYHSADTSREQYKQSVKWFKQKWFGQPRDNRLKSYIDEYLDRMRNEMYELIGKELTGDDGSKTD